MKRFIVGMFCVAGLLCLVGCEGSGGSGDGSAAPAAGLESGESASLSFQVEWVDDPRPEDLAGDSDAEASTDGNASPAGDEDVDANANAEANANVGVSYGRDPEPLTLAGAVKLSDDCSARGVANVRLSVRDSSGTSLKSGTFACSARQGTLTGVTPGSNRTIRVSGLTSSGTETWRGEKTGVTLAAGDNNIGTIQVEAYGGGEPPSGDTFTNTLGMTFVKINPGTFMMGSPTDEAERDSDETRHQVTLTKGYYLQTTEVTQGQWEAVMGSNPSWWCGDNCPVENVSWNDVQGFISALNTMEGTTKYRLPTEAEWEYAARAGTTTPFSFGNCLSTSQANYDGDYPYTGCSSGTDRKTTIEVGTLGKNAWGLYDMHGNVWEWCSDRYGSYPSSAVTDPTGPSSGFYRVRRGGSWDVNAQGCRSANRGNGAPVHRDVTLGFRLARTL